MQFKGKLLISKTHIKEKKEEVYSTYSCLIENGIFEEKKGFLAYTKSTLGTCGIKYFLICLRLSNTIQHEV